MVDVHPLRRPVSIAQERRVARFRAVSTSGTGGWADASCARVVLVAGATHLALGRRVRHVTQDPTVKALGLLRLQPRGEDGDMPKCSTTTAIWVL